MRMGAVVAVVLVPVLAGCTHHKEVTDPAEAQLSGPPLTVVTFNTADGWEISGDFHSPSNAKRAVIMLHQREGRARDWALLVPKLAEAGIATLALDARGVGRSKREHDRGEAPWDTAGDIAGAMQWLGTKGFTPDHIGLAGASYGANNVLLYAAKAPATPAVALLSPGKDYHGLVIEPAAKAYQGPLLLIYDREDLVMQGGPDIITRARNGAVDSVVYEGQTHGTGIYSAEAGALRTTVAFFTEHLPK